MGKKSGVVFVPILQNHVATILTGNKSKTHMKHNVEMIIRISSN
jgi:hypothetical protein